MAWDEDRLHRWLSRRARPRAVVGDPGDDAALLRASDARTAACVDQTIEGVHFEGSLPARTVGTKAARRSLSDLAASAARPRALLLALSAPRDTQEAWMRGAIEGVDRAARAVGAALVGGDLACAPGPRCLTVTALGAAPAGAPPARARAQPGNVLVVTGPLGGSLLGRHHRFVPRIREGAWLFQRGARAMMDVSDGLAWDLTRLARSAGVGVELDEIPVHRDARKLAALDGRSARWHALHDGEDYELIAALPVRSVARVRAEAPARCPGLAVIGRVVPGRGVSILEDGERVPWSGDGGWRHGT